MTSVLIVDDDRALVGMVASLLGSEGYDLLTAYDGETALRRHSEDVPDLVILDRRLPKMSGDEICRRIRAAGPTPILMLTGEKGEDERVKLLDLGADDYLEKPFGRKELLARVRALLRRAPPAGAAAAPTDIGGLRIDARAHSARMGGEELPLTPTEFRLLARLMSRPGEAVRRRELVRAGWPHGAIVRENTLDAYVARLRRKLKGLEHAPEIATVHGVGYRIER